MIIDTTGRKPIKVSVKQQPRPPQSEKVSAGDVVEVEVIRNGKTLYKGR